MEFSFSGISVAQGQAGVCHPVLGVPGLPAVRGRTCPLNGTVLVLISAAAVSEAFANFAVCGQWATMPRVEARDRNHDPVTMLAVGAARSAPEHAPRNGVITSQRLPQLPGGNPIARRSLSQLERQSSRKSVGPS